MDKSKSSNNHASPLKKDEKDDPLQSNSIDERNCASPREEQAGRSNSAGSADDGIRHFIALKPLNQAPQDSPVYFFDLDNTLYPKSSGIAELMVERIELFFVNYLKLPLEESRVLGARFYRDYGLAIKGLIKHFSIDPLEYDRYVDGGLPLEDILKPYPELTTLMDRLSKRGSCWVFTNAGKCHATRVLKLLQIDCFFSGVIYCDYSETDFPAKPDRSAFIRAMRCAAVTEPSKCFFFDDSIGNIRTAQEIGWKVVYIDEDSISKEKSSSSVDEINASMEIIPTDEINLKTYPTIKCIEDIERILNKLI